MSSFLFLAKRLLISSSSFPFHHQVHHHQQQLSLLTPLLLRRSLSTQSQQPKEPPFIAQYLISSFGFSPHRALKYSADSHLTPIKSSERPESVVTFLNDTGLTDDQIQAVVSFHSRILACNVEKTLKPKVRELIDAGFSRELLVQLILNNPSALERKNTLSRLFFWRNFVGNNDEVFLKILQKNSLLLRFDIDKHIFPSINLLKEYGLSSQDVVSLMMHSKSRYFGQNLDSLRQTLELIEELGISRGSNMFVYALKSIGGYSIGKIKRKVEFFTTTYGWSEEEVYTAFRKFPKVLAFSEDKVKSNMDFLVRNCGFESTTIALQPQLLGYSIKRVLIPRYTVISALEANGLKKKCSLMTSCTISERNFLKRYVVPYEKDVPGLSKAYADAFGGEVMVS